MEEQQEEVRNTIRDQVGLTATALLRLLGTLLDDTWEPVLEHPVHVLPQHLEHLPGTTWSTYPEPF
mgnify:CR=1 FL=1